MTLDPYAEAPPGGGRRLAALNPLAKIAGPVPAMVFLVFTRDIATPLAFLALAYVVLLVGARWSARLALVVLVAVPAGIALLGATLTLWTDASRVDSSVIVLRIGEWPILSGAVEIGFATALRIGAILALALIGGVTTTGPDLVRSLVQQLRVPYRVGYTALAAFRFVPRFGQELEVIRAARRVRGAHGGRGPFAAIGRGAGAVVPLLAGGIRHAERVALAMDARAFGAYPERTERHVVPFRRRDVVFVVGFWVVSVALAAALFPWGLA
ncbi:energy-coupling factor transporter transmembrane component T [Microbacterium sp. RD1]|uniref:energy-coupling factor transporter transmembrane component T n=1 Tax=Microbacterium sp. RD1 TaxID=3457313 RepID=UPI003FA55924